MSKKTTGLAAGNRRELGHSQGATVGSGGVAAGSVVMTLDGALPIEHLTPGDRIITRDGLRVLRGLNVRVARNSTTIRIGASTLGPDRPQDDVIVAPDQKVLVRDWRAKAMFGTERAMVEAERLVDGEFIRAEAVAELRLFTLEFDAPVVIYVNDLELGVEPATVKA